MNQSIFLTLSLVLILNFVTSTSHLRIKTLNNLAALRTTQTECLLKQSGSENFDLYKSEVNISEGTGYRTIGYHIDYEEPFCVSTTKVTVLAGLAGFDLDQSKDLNLFTAVENVTVTGFDVRLSTNNTSIVNGVMIKYNAYQIPDSIN